ncbi:hypothetical protein ACFLYV_00265 [Chloroflexota bacterium]
MGKRRHALHVWLLQYQPYKLIFGSIPSIVKAEKRWAMFQILLSFVFFFIATAIGFVTIDISKVHGWVMIVALIMFGLGGLALVYAFGVGLYWFSPKKNLNNDDEAKLNESLMALNNNINSLVNEIRKEREDINRRV